MLISTIIKLICSISLLFAIYSCSMNPMTKENIISTPDFSNIEEAMHWVHHNIQWISDKENYGVDDYWASPEQTFIKKSGDCEDQSILLMYIIKKQFDIKAEMISYKSYPQNHCIVKANNLYYDTTNNECFKVCNFIIATYSYDFCIEFSENLHVMN